MKMCVLSLLFKVTRRGGGRDNKFCEEWFEINCTA